MRSPQVCDYADVTYRRLDFWCRRGLIPGQPRHADGSGSQREFTRSQVAFVRCMAACVKAGLGLEKSADIAGHAAVGRSTFDIGAGLTLVLPDELVAHRQAVAS